MGRPLFLRVLEHLVGLRNCDPKTSLSTHRDHSHTGVMFDVKFKIFAQESRTSARKTLEAFWIHSKGPRMNRKEECLVITRPELGTAHLCTHLKRQVFKLISNRPKHQNDEVNKRAN
ncbi:hypothetical protein KIN20_005462 [Parelaphostrongylus tenuis]|uniref:Uncharacterized protein n=1 Tax=Parelaphostrongylus tenuis TaxID=148309 RepID=A0AAD5M399_PARTN|nr:hypothetical protein KIN20_005462 [Parelaphostrongylus tenuis]